MSTTTKSPAKRGRRKSTATGLDILKAIAEKGGRATAAELGVKRSALEYLASDAHKALRPVSETRKTTQDVKGRGRPSKVFALTSTGRSRVKRATQVSA